MAGKMTLELPPLKLVRQGPGTMKILSDQEQVPPEEFHEPPPTWCRSISEYSPYQEFSG
jgi:hypothetical protein